MIYNNSKNIIIKHSKHFLINKSKIMKKINKFQALKNNRSIYFQENLRKK